VEADLDGAADLLRVGLVQPGLARDVRDAPLLALLLRVLRGLARRSFYQVVRADVHEHFLRI